MKLKIPSLGHLLIFLFIVIICITLLALFLREDLGQPAERPFNKIYSNGWYDFTFNYPEQARISFAELDSNHIKISEKEKGCYIRVFPITSDYVIKKIRHIESKSKKVPVSINGSNWFKHRVGNEDFVYGGKFTYWVTTFKSHTIYMETGRKNERYCESILMTIRLQTDGKIESALESSKAKNVALNFFNESAKGRYLEGSFIYNDNGNYTTRNVYSTSDEAYVKVEDGSMTPTYIVLRKNDNTWDVVKVTKEKPLGN